MKRLPSSLKFGGIILLFLTGLALRVLFLPAISADMQWSLFAWYDFLKMHGAQGLGMTFATYTPPYLYLLWLATLTSNYLPKLIAIKLISILGDVIGVILIYYLVRLKYPSSFKPWLAAALFWVLPTPMINSSLWGEVDSLYTVFLLACLYFLLTDRPLWSVSSFGIAFALKAQAIFIFPVLIILSFKKRIAWQYFLLVPLVYVLFCLPSVLFGRSWANVLTIYLFQASVYHDLSRHAPNLYLFINSFPYNLGVTMGLIVAIAAIGCWILLNVRSKQELGPTTIIFMSLVSVALTPFLLPKMLDRYFYPADILALVAAFYLPELWFVPILYQIISASAYLVSLFDAPLLLIKVTALLNAATVFFLIWKQVQILTPTSSAQVITQKSLM